MKQVIGRMVATKLGTSSMVSRTNTNGESPWLTMIWMKRSDWVSQISATSPVVTSSSATSSWLKI